MLAILYTWETELSALGQQPFENSGTKAAATSFICLANDEMEQIKIRRRSTLAKPTKK